MGADYPWIEGVIGNWFSLWEGVFVEIKCYNLCSIMFLLSYLSFLLLNVFKLRIKLDVKTQVIHDPT